jgi:DNA-binding beta-propeller fold protein YncE
VRFRRSLAAVAVSLAMLLATGCRDGEGTAQAHARVVGTWGRQPGKFTKPRAVAVTRDGTLIAIDRSGRIQTFDVNTGALSGWWDLPEWANGTPTGVSIDPNDDTIWVADTHYQRILHYRADGTLISKFGERGSTEGRMIFPTDVAPDPSRDLLWVTEYGVRNRLMLFRRDGTFVREWGGPAYQDSELLRPQAVTIDAQGRVFVADAGHHKINVYDGEGELLYRFGTPGEGPGELMYPYDLSIANDGTLYVCEYGNDRISRFTLDGQYLGSWGRPGRGEGQLFSPWGVSAGLDGHLVVADTLNNRVQIIDDPQRAFTMPAPRSVPGP